MKRIVHYCVKHTSNVGDLAIVAEMHRLLASVHGDVSVATHDISELNHGSLLDFVQIIRSADLIIIGGGGLLSKFFWPLRPSFAVVCKWFRKRVCFYGVGIGLTDGDDIYSLPFNNIKFWLSRASFVSVRDELTRSELQRIGVNQSRLIGDPVLLYNRNRGLQRQTKLVGVNIANHGWASKEKVFRCIAEPIMPKLLELSGEGYQFLYLPHHPGEREVYKYLRGQLKIAWVEPSVDALYSAYESLEFHIAMMLHSTVFCTVTDTPFICLSYDQKNGAFLDLFGLRSLEYKLGELPSLDLAQCIRVAQSTWIDSAQTRWNTLTRLRAEHRKFCSELFGA